VPLPPAGLGAGFYASYELRVRGCLCPGGDGPCRVWLPWAGVRGALRVPVGAEASAAVSNIRGLQHHFKYN